MAHGLYARFSAPSGGARRSRLAPPIGGTRAALMLPDRPVQRPGAAPECAARSLNAAIHRVRDQSRSAPTAARSNMRHCRTNEIQPMADRQGLNRLGLNDDWMDSGSKLPWRVAVLEALFGDLGVSVPALLTAPLATGTNSSMIGRRSRGCPTAVRRA